MQRQRQPTRNPLKETGKGPLRCPSKLSISGCEDIASQLIQYQANLIHATRVQRAMALKLF